MKSFSLVLASSLVLFGLGGFHERPYPAAAVCLSSEEKKLYDLIMAYRLENHLESIPLSAKLSQVAQTHARDLSEHYTFDPNNKCNPHSWSSHGKWTSCCYTSDHKKASCMWTKPQEIARYTGNGFEIAYYSSIGATAKEGLDGWKVSAGHNPLLVNSGTWEKVKWKAIGIGIYKEYGLVWFGEVEDAEVQDSCP
jgi:uncharacterized protein YkwD